jgi:hypothetical protein
MKPTLEWSSLLTERSNAGCLWTRTEVTHEFYSRRYPFSQEELACLMEGRG